MFGLSWLTDKKYVTFIVQISFEGPFSCGLGSKTSSKTLSLEKIDLSIYNGRK